MKLITHQQPRPLCTKCNHKLCEGNGISANGFMKWAKYCTSCKKKAYVSRLQYKNHKKNHCEKCGFIAENPVQLDVDHIDGNKRNNEIANLQTLCANCHRLKTFLNKDYCNSYK